MLSRLFRREPVKPAAVQAPQFDSNPALDDQALRDAIAKVKTGNWAAARDAVAAAGTDWELRGRRITLLAGEAVENDAWLYGWLGAAADDPAAVLIQAAMLNGRAGEARGSAPANQTSAEQFRAFADLSEAAARVSRRAIALAGPHDPTPYVELLDSMFADGHVRVQSQDFHDVLAEARRRDPFNFDLNVTLVSLHCEKWYGSHEQMFAVAREVSAAAPPGSTAVMLPFLAHFEYAMREFSWNKANDQTVAAVAGYFQRPDVQAELDACTVKWRVGPKGPGRPMTMRNWLAMYYFLANRPAEALAVFAEIGPYIGGTLAWEYFLGPAESGSALAWRLCHQAMA